MNAPDLRLHSDSLLSKWGFNDGDTPEEFLDFWDEVGVDYSRFEWRSVLVTLVREHLLPRLAENHDIVVSEVSGHHNPIRIERVDGVEIDLRSLEAPVQLRPESVLVPYRDVARACGLP